MANGTKSRDFGSSNRENHDSSYFYQSKIYQDQIPIRQPDEIENAFPKKLENTVIVGDSRDLSLIPDLSIHLVICSPPYSTTKKYEDDLTLDEYLSLIKNVFSSVYPKLVDGGRL